MFLTGYHGTTLDDANNIIKDGSFKISNSDTEWLGEGIYYYFNISDAYINGVTQKLFCILS